MSIVNVNQIQPVGSGQTVTINAANISAGSATVTAGSFVGNLSGNVTGDATGLSGTPNLNVGILTASSFSGSGSGLTGVGKILQVVQASGTGTVTNSSNSTWEILRERTITLSSTSNYVLIFATTNLQIAASTNAFGQAAVFHTSTSGTLIVRADHGLESSVNSTHKYTLIAKHEPASIAEQTYVFAMRKGSGGTTSVNTDSQKYEIILMEVAS